MLTLDAANLIRSTTSAGGLADALLRWLTAVLICAFYGLIIWSYLRRGRAVATTGSRLACCVAVVATCTPFVFPLLAGAYPASAALVSGDVLLAVGTAWSVWSLRHLGKNLSVIAQARGVAERGPYRYVRHPLYTGEIVSGLGLAITAGTWPAFALWTALIAMQVYRARREEQVLVQALPGYRDYRARTAALLPGLF
jgi:protein-S-isoprenylcysteine O-methyltransferase Ste14